MKPDQTNIQELWDLFISDKASIQQVNTLFEYIKNAAHDDENIAFFREAINKIPSSFYKTDDEVVHSKLDSIIASDKDLKDSLDKNTSLTPVRHITLLSKWGWAAASILLLLGIGSYFLLNKKEKQPTIAVNTPTDIAAPTGNRAMITLADGTKVFLDSVGKGQLAQQGSIKLIKLANGKIAYQPLGDGRNQSVAYNTLVNPRGSKVIDMQLSDGSHVWLNAGSAITYPVAFIGNDRSVELEGEGYFEVAKDAKRKFIVTANGVNTEVLGTHFNVNAFKDDGQDIKITLLEGSVKINNGNATGLLKPGQQALVANEVKIVSDVDLHLVMAWKNGYFQFDKASLQNVMKQVSRWYDVDVVYEGYNQPREFAGEIQRDLSLSEVLKILEKNKVHFRIEGKELRVMPD
jgi:ferric-dicitrate binding protein FerR (iron transport regulator)